MDFSKSFTVKNSPKFCRFCIVSMLLITLGGIVYAILDPEPPSIDCILLVILYITLAVLLTLWLIMYRVTVNGRRISVRKEFGMSQFSLDVSEISKIMWITTNIETGRNDNIKIYTVRGQKFNIESMMLNSDQFIQYIYENVEEYKICRSQR